MKKLWLLVLLFYAQLLLANDGLTKENTMTDKTKALATFAGGCFWCMEAPFQQLEGVSAVISGYSGGETVNPSYEQVSSGQSGHLEVVQIHYDPTKIQYEQLLQVFWRQIDPTDASGSFVDRGSQYRSAIFYHDSAQQQAAQAAIDDLNQTKKYAKKIVTELLPYRAFYPAEDYHQDYSKNNPIRYKYYRKNSGRDQYIQQTWGDDVHNLPKCEIKTQGAYQKPTPQVLQQQLNPLQYQVTQQAGTEPPFNNDYWNNKQAGIYVDVVSGEPLFSSLDKFDSKTGWPSFSKTIESNAVIEKVDKKLFVSRTEIRSRKADSHLGHVFNDGPKPTGLRYCINSAALRFVPKEKLATEGYADYLPLFE